MAHHQPPAMEQRGWWGLFVATGVFDDFAVVGQGAGWHHLDLAAQLGHFTHGFLQLHGQASSRFLGFHLQYTQQYLLVFR